MPAGGALLLLIEGTCTPAAKYRPDSAASHGDSCRGCELTFTHVAAKADWARIRIAYRNSTEAPRYAELRINAQGPTTIAFPPAGAGVGEVSILGRLDRTGDANVLTFSLQADLTALIVALNVE